MTQPPIQVFRPKLQATILNSSLFLTQCFDPSVNSVDSAFSLNPTSHHLQSTITSCLNYFKSGLTVLPTSILVLYSPQNSKWYFQNIIHSTSSSSGFWSRLERIQNFHLLFPYLAGTLLIEVSLALRDIYMIILLWHHPYFLTLLHHSVFLHCFNYHGR